MCPACEVTREQREQDHPLGLDAAARKIQRAFAKAHRAHGLRSRLALEAVETPVDEGEEEEVEEVAAASHFGGGQAEAAVAKALEMDKRLLKVMQMACGNDK